MFTTIAPAGINALCLDGSAIKEWVNTLHLGGHSVLSTMKMANVPGFMMYNQMLRKFISLDSPLSHPNKV